MGVINPGGGGGGAPTGPAGGVLAGTYPNPTLAAGPIAAGTAGARPAAAAGNAKTGYYATDTGELTVSDGAAWNAIKGTSATGFTFVSGGAGAVPYINFADALGGTLRAKLQTNSGDLNIVELTPNGQFMVDQSINAHLLGQGFKVVEGANGKQGVATLVAGTVTVANTSVTASSRIFLTAQDNSTTGIVRVSARVVGTSFTITSSNAGDTGVVAWEIFEPG